MSAERIFRAAVDGGVAPRAGGRTSTHWATISDLGWAKQLIDQRAELPEQKGTDSILNFKSINTDL